LAWKKKEKRRGTHRGRGGGVTGRSKKGEDSNSCGGRGSGALMEKGEKKRMRGKGKRVGCVGKRKKKWGEKEVWDQRTVPDIDHFRKRGKEADGKPSPEEKRRERKNGDWSL